jgi:hypothetical protein
MTVIIKLYDHLLTNAWSEETEKIEKTAGDLNILFTKRGKDFGVNMSYPI